MVIHKRLSGKCKTFPVWQNCTLLLRITTKYCVTVEISFPFFSLKHFNKPTFRPQKKNVFFLCLETFFEVFNAINYLINSIVYGIYDICWLLKQKQICVQTRKFRIKFCFTFQKYNTFSKCNIVKTYTFLKTITPVQLPTISYNVS